MTSSQQLAAILAAVEDLDVVIHAVAYEQVVRDMMARTGVTRVEAVRALSVVQNSYQSVKADRR